MKRNGIVIAARPLLPARERVSITLTVAASHALSRLMNELPESGWPEKRRRAQYLGEAAESYLIDRFRWVFGRTVSEDLANPLPTPDKCGSRGGKDPAAA